MVVHKTKWKRTAKDVAKMMRKKGYKASIFKKKEGYAVSVTRKKKEGMKSLDDDFI